MIRYTLIGGLAILFFMALLKQGPSLFTTPATSATEPILTDGDFTYHLHEPDRTASLDDDLDEISGLAYVGEDTLAAINDEQGYIFLWSDAHQAIIDKIDFGGDGDYEGIAVNNTTAYVLRSDGDIYEVTYFRNRPQTTKYENRLSDRNDTEGLTYDSKQQMVLIACKATGKLNDGTGSKRTLVYQYPLVENPILTPLIRQSKEDGLHPERPRPSGIARHPVTGGYYVLSSADQVLMVFDNHYRLHQMVRLPNALFPQAEGICFSPDGTLYIANEKKKKLATLLRFNRR
ncbi:MAG: hypothetical protein AAF632_09945 [Bacteroidota bacterium]